MSTLFTSLSTPTIYRYNYDYVTHIPMMSSSLSCHRQQTMVLVPMRAKGVEVVRPLPVFGYDDAPHGHAETLFTDVTVPVKDACLLGEGRGFEIAQGRLGPGRLHHCMRLIGMGERALTLAARRAEVSLVSLYLPLPDSNYLFNRQARVAFGQPLSKNASVLQTLGKMRVQLDGAKLATLDAARLLDAEGNKSAKGAIAACKGEFILILARAIVLTSCFFLSRGAGCCHRGHRRGDSDPRCVGRVRRHPAGEDVRGCADVAVGGRAGRGSPGDHSQVGSAAVAAVGLISDLFVCQSSNA